MKDSIPNIEATINDQTLYIAPSKGYMAGAINKSDTANIVESNNNDSLSTGTQADIQRYDGTNKPFTMEQADSVFGLLLLCFLLFAHIYSGGIAFLKENFSLLLSPEKGQRSSYKQTTTREVLYSYFLIFLAVVLISISVYDLLIEYYPISVTNIRKPMIVICLFIVAIGLFIGIKNIIYRILDYIFDSNSMFSVWRRTYIISLEILGILYFIPTLFLIYAGHFQFQIIIFMLILFLRFRISLLSSLSMDALIRFWFSKSLFETLLIPSKSTSTFTSFLRAKA